MKKFFVILFLPFLCSCGQNNCNHSIVIDSAIPATCSMSGLTQGSHCEICGTVIEKQEIISALGHNIIIDNAQQATCTCDGLSYGAHCDRCGEVLLEQNLIQHSGHNIVIDPAVKPTCTKDGLTQGSHCETCGEIIEKQEIISALGHNIIIDNAQQATCTCDGLSYGAHCDRCGEVILEQNLIQHSGHNIVIDPAVKPTCTKDGLTQGSHCETCGEIIEEQKSVPAIGHTFVIDMPVDSTCENEGLSYGIHCSICGNVLLEQTCTGKKSHTKGKLLEICTEKMEGLSNCGIFSCSVCGKEYYDSINFGDVELPILDIAGDIKSASKTNKEPIFANYIDINQNFSYNATIKVQGSSSVNYPKKNYNIQFFTDESLSKKQKVKLQDNWGKESKYTLKANYVDYSAARNIVSSRLYGEVVKSRNKNDELNKLLNGGAIDGYPLLLFANGECLGLYTLNLAKDDYLFDMSSSPDAREAILQGTLLLQDTFTDRNQEGLARVSTNKNWSIEFSSTEDFSEIDENWIIDSFENYVSFIKNSTDVDFKSNYESYFDLDRTIDTMLFTWMISAGDNISKNILWITYDGVHWLPSVYDMDGTWGMGCDGSFKYMTPTAWMPYKQSILWQRIYENFYDDIVIRWRELRSKILTVKNIDNHFISFLNQIPSYAYDFERAKWIDVPSQEKNSILQITDWVQKKLASYDKIFEFNVSETEFYRINFVNNEHVKIYVYVNSDYTRSFAKISDVMPFSRDGETGLLTNSDGQINFEIEVDDGYSIKSIDISGTYKNLKNSSETGKDNTYRITKIASNLAISFEVEQI